MGEAPDSPRHRMTIRVYYEDTDFSGVVYHASFLRFMERGRTELIRDLGIAQGELHESGQALAFAVRSMTIDYLKPGRMDDLLTVTTTPRELRGASMLLEQEIHRNGLLLVKATVTVVCVSGGRARRIPNALRHRLGGATAMPD